MFYTFLQNVVGEVYEVDDVMLSRLDVLEDHPSFYVREIDEIQLNGLKEDVESPKTLNCWIYFLKKFKPYLLSEPFLKEYHSEGDHAKPYMPKEARTPGYHAKTDVLIS